MGVSVPQIESQRGRDPLLYDALKKIVLELGRRIVGIGNAGALLKFSDKQEVADSAVTETDGTVTVTRSAAGQVGPELVLLNPANRPGDKGAVTFVSSTIPRSRIIAGTTTGSFGGDIALQTIPNYYTPTWQTVVYVTETARVGVNKTAPMSPFAVLTLPAYANNAAAVTGGLTAGDFYTVTGSDPRQVAVVY